MRLMSRSMAPKIEIVPSVLPANFANLGEECRRLGEAGADRIQWDVMDGNFVPNLTFGPEVIAACRPHTDVMFEAHLMVTDPDLLAAEYVEAGCQMLIVHAETSTHLHRTLANVRTLGAKPAVALNPATPAEAIAHVLDLVDMVLVMTVNPGFGGQAYISTMEPKIAQIRAMLDERGLTDVDIEVDGGISTETIGAAASAGANVFISGSALFRYPTLAEGIEDLRSKAAG